MTAAKKAPALTASTIADASKAELLAFAQAECGLEFEDGAGRDYIESEIRAYMEWVPKDPSENATYAVIKVGKTSDPDGSDPVQGGFNGQRFSFRREEEVEVPIGYYNVLMDVNSLGFTVAPMVKGDVKEAPPTTNIIQKTKYPIQVIRFIQKG